MIYFVVEKLAFNIGIKAFWYIKDFTYIVRNNLNFIHNLNNNIGNKIPKVKTKLCSSIFNFSGTLPHFIHIIPPSFNSRFPPVANTLLKHQDMKIDCY